MSPCIAQHILRPDANEKPSILFIAEYAPDEFAPRAKTFNGDGGYPEYHYSIYKTLGELGYRMRSSAQPTSALFAGGNIDFVFSLYNRMPVNNSEILVSAFCEYVRIPYLGAPPGIRALAEDKWLTKLAARSIGIPTIEGLPYSSQESLAQAPAFPGPYFVKDRFGAGSEGITVRSLQTTWEGARAVAAQRIAEGVPVLVERYAPGIDITVPILGGSSPLLLGFVHPRSDKPGNILTADLKMNDPMGYELRDLSTASNDIHADMMALWSAAGPMDYLRMDYRYDPDTGQRWFLEFNLCCYIGTDGAICIAGAGQGLSQSDILGHVVEFGLRRQRGSRQHLKWVL
jgi:D-alanine-D-alanine ligase